MADKQQNYALIHGLPLSSLQPGAPYQPHQTQYHLEADRIAQLQSLFPLALNPSMLNDSQVTEALLLRLTDCDSMAEIRVISLRNKELTSCLRTLSQCSNLTICYLQGNRMHLQDMMYLQMLKQLKKIDLSNCNLATLPSGQVWAGMTELKFLYLHKNRISKWGDIQSVSSLKQVIHITLFQNQVCTVPGYRHYLVNSIPSLLALDTFVITDEERIEDASFGYRYRALNEYMKLHIPDYAREKSAEQHLFNLEVDIYRLRRIFERNSPSIMIQALFRGYRQRNLVRFQAVTRWKNTVTIQKVVRSWLVRLRFKKDLYDMLAYTGQEYLLLSNQEIRIRSAGSVIKKFLLKKYREKKREQLEIQCAIKIQRIFRGRQARLDSFKSALQLDKYPRIYLLKEQKPLFLRILRELEYVIEARFDLRFEELSHMIKEDDKYDTMRVAEPDIFDYKWMPIVQFTKPTAISRIRDTKHRHQHCFARKEFSLMNLFFTPNKEESDKRWKILQIRNSKVHKRNVIDTIQRRHKGFEAKTIYVFQDQYRDFLVFEPQQIDLLTMILSAILLYNREANLQGDQQMLLFFEGLIKRVCAASMIQRNWRSHIFRRKFQLQKYPVQELFEQRAATCLQRWWSNLRLRKRIHGLERINKHISKISNKVLFIEESIYNNFLKITKMIETQMRFEEQTLDFDFNHLTHQIHLAINENHKYVSRYHSQAIPNWFNFSFRAIDFEQTSHYNSLQALFHFNQADSHVLPVSHVIDVHNKELDLDQTLTFISIACTTVDEAKRRAYIIAALTYDIHQHLFVRAATSEMLVDPFMIQNILNLRRRFEIDIDVTPPVPIQYADQQKQEHQGLVLSEKDSRITRFASCYNNIFKRLELENEKTFLISAVDQVDSALFDLEVVQREARLRPQNLTLFENKKLHQEAFRLLKERRNQAFVEGIQEFKDSQLVNKSLIKASTEKYILEKREEVNKIREISKIISVEQKTELDRNLSVFLSLNKEEKNLRKELVEKQVEVEYKEKYLKKVAVVQQHRMLQVKKDEKINFVNSFIQAKNLIEKQMKIGKQIKDRKIQRQAKQEFVSIQKEQRQQSKDVIAVRSVLFDHGIAEEPMSRQKVKLLNNSSFLSQQRTNDDTPCINQVTYGSDTGRKCLLTTMADESKSRQAPFALKQSLNLQSSFNKSSINKSLNRSYALPPLNQNDSSFYGGRNIPNNLNHYQTHATRMSGYHEDNRRQSSSKGVEEVYSYVHQDSISSMSKNWKRNQSKPVFAEENFPMRRNTGGLQQNQAAYNSQYKTSQVGNSSHYANNHNVIHMPSVGPQDPLGSQMPIDLNFHNPLQSLRKEGTGVFNSHTSYSLQPALPDMHNESTIMSNPDQVRRQSERRSLLQKIIT